MAVPEPAGPVIGGRRSSRRACGCCAAGGSPGAIADATTTGSVTATAACTAACTAAGAGEPVSRRRQLPGTHVGRACGECCGCQPCKIRGRKGRRQADNVSSCDDGAVSVCASCGEACHATWPQRAEGCAPQIGSEAASRSQRRPRASRCGLLASSVATRGLSPSP